MSMPPSDDAVRMVRVSGCLVIASLFFLTCLLPILFVDMMQTALANLHLSPQGAALVMIGLIFGSLINLPLYTIPQEREVLLPMVEPVAGWQPFPQFQRAHRGTLVAVNVGGCLVPLLLTAWLLPSIFHGGTQVVTVLLFGLVLNSFLCFRAARPIPHLGVAIPMFIPPMVSLLVTWLGLPDVAMQPYHAPVAFVVGITGPLIGADLLHWRDFSRISTGIVSIGGAGTFDGIVIAGLLAAFLA